MHRRRRMSLLLAAGVLALSFLACNAPPPPSPTSLPSLPSSTVPPVPPSPTSTPTSTVVPPTEMPRARWLPAGTVALYAAGAWESSRLYALAADGTATDLGQDVQGWAAVSRTGRWTARPGSPYPADSLVIVNLADGMAYTVPATPGLEVYSAAFDSAETRLAFLELGAPTGEDTPWAIVVASLADGSTARFEATARLDSALLPGFPIGWSAAGDELFINTFAPATEYSTAGVVGIAMPPGATAALVDALARRGLLAGGTYSSVPRLSPDAARLLYVARDPDYTPANYEPIAYDTAVNQLWALDVASGLPALLVEVTDGGALGGEAAWSPDGTQVLFAQGVYTGDTFAGLTLKIRDGSGDVRDIGPLPLLPGGWLSGLDWCMPEAALATVTTADSTVQLHTVDLASGGTSLVTSGEYVSVLGCIP